MQLFHTLISITAIAAQVGHVAAIFGMSSCGTRCYDLTAKLIGCDQEDYVCHCTNFDSKFLPQWDTCRIEGCAFEDPGVTSEELKSRVCAQTGGLPGDPPSNGTPAPTPSTSLTDAVPSQTLPTLSSPPPPSEPTSSLPSGAPPPTVTSPSGPSRSSTPTQTPTGGIGAPGAAPRGLEVNNVGFALVILCLVVLA